MGAESSTLKSGGTLVGAYGSPLPGVHLPEPRDPEPPLQTFDFEAVVPRDKRGGQKMVALIKGEKITLDIPIGMKSGDRFRFQRNVSRTIVITRHVIASTLPTVPGMIIAQAKPIIWGSVSHAFGAGSTGSGQQAMGRMVGTLMQDVQTQIMEQAVLVGCNAVLGMNFNVTNDSSGEYGSFKLVIVTVYGTPCTVVPAGQ
jgi:uncharacterized protein YbjQ (UPF0145 family)